MTSRPVGSTITSTMMRRRRAVSSYMLGVLVTTKEVRVAQVPPPVKVDFLRSFHVIGTSVVFDTPYMTRYQ